MGTTTFHLFLISFDIRRLTPLSLLPLRFPWSGCWHFIEDLNFTPNWSRCFGQIVKSRPPSANNPTRARISSFSEETLVWDTEICRRGALISLTRAQRKKLVSLGWNIAVRVTVRGKGTGKIRHCFHNVKVTKKMTLLCQGPTFNRRQSCLLFSVDVVHVSLKFLNNTFKNNFTKIYLITVVKKCC